MQTHRDDEHLRHDPVMAEIFAEREKALAKLQIEGAEALRVGASSITAGRPGEQPIREWEKYGVVVRELPERETDEALNVVRISIGGSFTEGMAYCVFRGSVSQVKDVLRRALNALRDAP